MTAEGRPARPPAGARRTPDVPASSEPDDGFGSLAVELGAERSETGFGAPAYRFGFEIGVSY